MLDLSHNPEVRAALIRIAVMLLLRLSSSFGGKASMEVREHSLAFLNPFPPKFKSTFFQPSQRVKVRSHVRCLMRFRVQNAPYPTLHECFFLEASRGLEKKLSPII